MKSTKLKKNIIKVYCEAGATTKQLKRLQSNNIIEFHYVTYDGTRNEKIKKIAQITGATLDDIGKVRLNEIRDHILDDMRNSEKYKIISKIIGESNRKDIMHIDSAYISDIKYFFSTDIGDIISKRDELFKEIGIKFYNPNNVLHMKEFLKEINYSENSC